jgi:hypothetical protein
MADVGNNKINCSTSRSCRQPIEKPQVYLITCFPQLSVSVYRWPYLSPLCTGLKLMNLPLLFVLVKRHNSTTSHDLSPFQPIYAKCSRFMECLYWCTVYQLLLLALCTVVLRSYVVTRTRDNCSVTIDYLTGAGPVLFSLRAGQDNIKVDLKEVGWKEMNLILWREEN